MASQLDRLGITGLRFSRDILRRNAIGATKVVTDNAAGLKGWRRPVMTSFLYQAVPSTQILMPALSPTMEEGTIVKWMKKEGDAVSAGDVLCEIETDKATISMDSDEEGVLAKIIVPDGTKNVKVNELIALMVEEGVDYTQVEVPIDTDVKQWKRATTTEQSSLAASGDTVSFSGLMSPAVRVLLETYDLEPRLIPATGPKGRLLKGDVLRFLTQEGQPFTKPKVLSSSPDKTETGRPVRHTSEVTPVITSSMAAPGPEPVIGSDYTDIPHTNMRRTIAKRLTESKSSIPHAYVSTDCVMDNLLQLRAGLDVKVSVNDFIVKAAAMSLEQVPEMNASWKNGDTELLNNVDISVAVATHFGLITPIVKNANNLKVIEISSALKDLATRAREGKLQLHEFQGGSFTISNLGMYGITEFSAVINPPQACIMSVGGTRPVLTPEDTVQRLVTVTLSYDRRTVDEEVASRWLEVFQSKIENPATLLL